MVDVQEIKLTPGELINDEADIYTNEATFFLSFDLPGRKYFDRDTAIHCS